MQLFDTSTTDTAAALDAGQALQLQSQEVQYLHDATGTRISAPFIINSSGEAKAIDYLLPKPFRHKAKPTFADVVSFIEYVNIYKSASTLIFSKVDNAGGVFRAALDLAAKDDTSWNEHSATFTLETTPDWKLWTERNKRWLNQEEFILFVETQRHVFSEPSSATMLEIAMSLEATVGGAYKSAFRPQNGDRTLVLDMSTVATYGKGEAKIAIPEEITIILTPFEGQNPVSVSAFLRFRPTGEGVKFQYELQRPEESIRASAEEARTRIAGETGCTVLNGTL